VVVKTFCVCEDQPRKRVGSNIEHYVEVCSLFTPLLEEIEQALLSKNINDAEYLYLEWNGTDDEVDDTLLGLRANPGVSEPLCMRLSPCRFSGSSVELFWV